MDWLVPMDPTTADDYTRAVAEKADVLLRSARFLAMHHQKANVDMEVRVWVEAACANACVSITWEPGVQRFGFHLLDESLHDRLACVVFERLPCVDGRESEAQADHVVDAMLDALRDRPHDLAETAERVREAARRVRVEPGPQEPLVRYDRDVDPGVER